MVLRRYWIRDIRDARASIGRRGSIATDAPAIVILADGNPGSITKVSRAPQPAARSSRPIDRAWAREGKLTLDRKVVLADRICDCGRENLLLGLADSIRHDGAAGAKRLLAAHRRVASCLVLDLGIQLGAK